MNVTISDPLIPGTVLKKKAMDGTTGLAFLKKVFFIGDGIMLTQIRDISGIDGSTLQNWTKRGWVEKSVYKKYSIDQVAHILIINMLRSCMQLDDIAFLIQYINGRVDDASDDIISDSALYDCICRCAEALEKPEYLGDPDAVAEAVAEVTADYIEPMPGARERLSNALCIIMTYYCASLVKRDADALLGQVK